MALVTGDLMILEIDNDFSASKEVSDYIKAAQKKGDFRFYRVEEGGSVIGVFSTVKNFNEKFYKKMLAISSDFDISVSGKDRTKAVFIYHFYVCSDHRSEKKSKIMIEQIGQWLKDGGNWLVTQTSRAADERLKENINSCLERKGVDYVYFSQ